MLDVEVFRLEEGTEVAAFEPTMALAARLGLKYGLNANLEPMPWVEVSTVAKARRLLSSVSRQNAALLVDPIHFFRADNRFDELNGAPRSFLAGIP